MSSNFVNGSGISVSVESTPPRSSASSGNGVGLGAPMKKRYEEESVVVEQESISPRVLFRDEGVARRLDFYSSGEWSPIPLATASSVASWASAMPIVVAEPEEEKPVGECSVCYATLPARSNHVFTLCGHLFCVKCLLMWWDTSTTCPMCRAEILESDAAVLAWRLAAAAAAVAVAAAAAAAAAVSDEVVDVSSSSSDDEWSVGGDGGDGGDGGGGGYDYNDDFVGGGGSNHLPARPIPVIDRYLYADDGIEWSILSGSTDPARDDELVHMTQTECSNIRWNRARVSMLWARRRFLETLYSDIDFLGETFHTFIQRHNWLGLSHVDMGPHLMFEFVLRQSNQYTEPRTNFFGYISRRIVIEAYYPNTTTSYDAYVNWENNHEYAFVVNVFSPTTAPYNNTYNVDEGTFETAELVFRFADISRMYLIQTCERVSA